MTRSLHALILLTVLLWQSWAAVGATGVAVRVDEPLHVDILLSDASHAVDLVAHLDADEAPVQHVHLDGGAGGNELLSSSWPCFFLPRSVGFPEFVARHWQSAPADGFLRPPRLTA
ncbi:hypothetical protein [uncultured Rhodoferax sp.]|uniref:hypothetical protein n=1 Tax=uncultured Rhodoferax sp. TaxID=223188 RepID=UPI0025CC1D2B|nr:hypothetical protein [uncultured Rhodoferax sp.]